MTENLKYSDVALIPKYCLLSSRSEADTTVCFANRKWDLPVIPANMSSTISFELAKQLEAANYFYILHRFYDYNDIFNWCADNQDIYLSISVGIGEKDYDLVHMLADNKLRIDCFTIDIAHGHSRAVAKMIRFIKDKHPQTFVIAGNVATPEAVNYLASFKADAVKVGVGPGLVCTTFTQTGFGTIDMFSTVQRCTTGTNIPIIADGGIRYNGDIAKSLVAGATMCMVGGMFVELADSPAETMYDIKHNLQFHGCGFPAIEVDKSKPVKKVYFGSASDHQKGENKYVEGKRIEVKYNPMTYLEKMNEVQQSLQSSISYAGGHDLNAFSIVKYNVIK